MSVAGQSPVPHVAVLSPAEAVRRALPLPAGEDLALRDLTDDEWEAFQRALTER